MKNYKAVALKVGAGCATVLAAATASVAAISAPDVALIQAGITASDATFYTIGGGILVVLAGIWGFKKVRGMF